MLRECNKSPCTVVLQWAEGQGALYQPVLFGETHSLHGLRWQTTTHMQPLPSGICWHLKHLHVASLGSGTWCPFTDMWVPSCRTGNDLEDMCPILHVWASCLHFGSPCAHRGRGCQRGRTAGSSAEASTQLWPGGPRASLCTERVFSELYWFVELQDLKKMRRVRERGSIWAHGLAWPLFDGKMHLSKGRLRIMNTAQVFQKKSSAKETELLWHQTKTGV